MIEGLFSLQGQVAVVTGASSGIGRALAGFLAQAGAAVVLVARREAALREIAAEISQGNGKAAAVGADLSDIEAIESLPAALGAAFGAPTILINAAGINLREHASQVTVATWQQTLDLNLAAPFFLAKALEPGMRNAGYGRIVNIASLQSRRAFPNGIAYGASKGGVEQLTRAMAEAWSGNGITANALAPGFFPTELTAPVFDNPDTEAWAAGQTTMGRNGQMPDLAGAVIFLTSPASGYITGQTLFVDGGFTAR
jgi:NAD(P)-dependent dehydrogenase (short-subunit alcohol dehydrogenase family)